MKKAWLVLIVMLAIMASGLGCSAQKKPSPATPSKNSTAQKPATQQPAAQPAQISGASIYTTNCASCHGVMGKGVAQKGPKLNTAEWNDPQKVIPIVTKGKGSMPGFKGTLTEAQIKSVADYVATLSKK